MGNLGRAGFGASTDGMWPYTYDACDVGTLANQTMPDGTPYAGTHTGLVEDFDYELSFLPGMRLSSCTCPGETHPGPVHRDGTFVSRSAPEIDVIEGALYFCSRNDS
jgi:beta-glucanase (GH16 family)